MEIITMPRPMRWIWASLGAYWLAHIIHPGFVSIAIMALLMIPLLIADLMFPPRPPVPVKHSADIPETLEWLLAEACGTGNRGRRYRG